MPNALDALTHCLQADPRVAEAPTLAHWQPGWQARVASGAAPINLALLAGFAADRPAWAFAAGYQAALRTLLPSAGARELIGLCLTEPGGKRPRELRCTATPQADATWQVSGEKSWVAFGAACTTLLVIARQDDGADPPHLVALVVPQGAAGLQLRDKPPGGLMPELPQGTASLQQVCLPATARLPGDGYSDHAKPFAALEDLYIAAAMQAYLLREARARQWPAPLRERLAAGLVVMAGLASAPAKAPATLVALAGALDLARQAYAEAGALFSASPDDPVAVRWLRDARFLGAAGPTRVQRAAKAWGQLATDMTLPPGPQDAA